MNITKKQRIGIVVSAIWLILAYMGSYNNNGWFVIQTFLTLGVLPVGIGWGIWWIRRGNPKKSKGDDNQ